MAKKSQEKLKIPRKAQTQSERSKSAQKLKINTQAQNEHSP
jgi:hypothetical protein